MSILPQIELHTHILPGLDDGPDDIDESLRMCGRYAELGFKKVVATPHMCHPAHNPDVDSIQKAVENLTTECRQRSIPLEILTGAEVRLTPELLDMLDDGELLTLADEGRYLILEFPPRVAPPIEELIFQLGLRDVTVILCHPERNLQLRDDPDRIADLIRRGCLMQMSIGSIVGDFGRGARKAVGTLLDKELFHLACGDAHGARDGYWPDYRHCVEELIRLGGSGRAKRILVENPRRVIEGQNLS